MQSTTVFDEETCYRCRGDFPSLWRTFGGHPVAFLDGPGGTQVPKPVVDAIVDCYRNRNVNVHGNFAPSAELDERMLEARCAVADLLGVHLWGVNFSRPLRAPTVSFTVDGVDPAVIAKTLGKVGICVWDGSFYAPRPVDILNVPGGSLLRVGFSMYNTKEEADRLVKCVVALAPKN